MSAFLLDKAFHVPFWQIEQSQGKKQESLVTTCFLLTVISPCLIRATVLLASDLITGQAGGGPRREDGGPMKGGTL